MVKTNRECVKCDNMFWISEEENQAFEDKDFVCALCDDSEIITSRE